MACRVKIGVGRGVAEARVLRQRPGRAALLPRATPHRSRASHRGRRSLPGTSTSHLPMPSSSSETGGEPARPVAGNLAIGAYAAAMVHGMRGHGNARARSMEITRSLLPTPDRFATSDHLWRVTLDALLALHCGEPETANELLHDGARTALRRRPKPISALGAVVHGGLSPDRRAHRPSRHGQRYCNAPPNPRTATTSPPPSSTGPRRSTTGGPTSSLVSPDGSPTPGALTRPYVPRLLPTTLGVERPREGLTTVLPPESPFIDLPTSEHSGRKQLTPAIAGTTDHPHTAPGPSLDRRVARLIIPASPMCPTSHFQRGRHECLPNPTDGATPRGRRELLRTHPTRIDRASEEQLRPLPVAKTGIPPEQRGRTQMASTAQRVFPGEGFRQTPTAARQPAFDECQPPGAGGVERSEGCPCSWRDPSRPRPAGTGKRSCYNR